MTIIGGSNGKTTTAQLNALAAKLKATRPASDSEYTADFFVGAAWSVVVGKEKTEKVEVDESEPNGPKQEHELEEDDLIDFSSLKNKLLKSEDKFPV